MRMKHFTAISEPLPVVGLGCWAMGAASGWSGADDEESLRTISHALEIGVTFLDTAPVYGRGASERLVGRAIRGRRDRVFLASKCGLVWTGDGPITRDLTGKNILREIEASLTRLGTDHIDLYQLHWPDPVTPLEETAKALLAAKQAGKIRYIGVSNFSAERTREAHRLFGVCSYQGIYNLLERNSPVYHDNPLEYRTERDILPICRELGIPYLPFSPLMQGLLTEEYRQIERIGADDVRALNPKLNGSSRAVFLEIARTLSDFAKTTGHPLEHLAMGWLIRQKEVGPIICGARSPAEIERNVAVGDWELDDAAAGKLEALLEPWKGPDGAIR